MVLVLKNEEDLLATSLVGSPSDVVGLLEVGVDELVPEFCDGLYEVEFEWVLVTVFDLELWPGHVYIYPRLLPLVLELVDDFPQDHGSNP